MSNVKIIIIDDDPTGSQTVNSCPLVLSWDQITLRRNLRNNSHLLFILANTRGMIATEAATVISDICRSLKIALLAEKIQNWLLISRSDSTLRGHFPLETDVITAELGPFDATFIIPSFLEGKRETVDAVHLLNGIPVHKTPFASDHLFGYDASFLPHFITQKSNYRLKSSNIIQINHKFLDQTIINHEAYEILKQQLIKLGQNVFVTVDAQKSDQLKIFSNAIKQVCFNNKLDHIKKKFLFRSAASLITQFNNVPIQPTQPYILANLRRKNKIGKSLPGLIMVGSYVPLSDAQLNILLIDPRCIGIELPVIQLVNIFRDPLAIEIMNKLEQKWFQNLQSAIEKGQTPVLFTSRGELSILSSQERIVIGYKIAQLMARLASALAPQLGYMISKGGITTHVLLTEGLKLRWIYLDGQILPGLSFVRQLESAWVSPSFQGLPILTFPGNLGDANTLKDAWNLMEQRN